MIIRAIFTATFTIGWWLHHHDPVTRLADKARTQPGWRWTPIAAAVSAACFLAAATLLACVNDGAPQWLNWITILVMWEAIKTALLVPLSLVWTARATWCTMRSVRAAGRYRMPV